MRAACLALLLGSIGCLERQDVFTCTDVIQCKRGGEQGTCEATTGFCSFADAQCDSGRRYGEGAAELVDTCVIATSCPASALLCDDFEGASAWSGVNGDATVVTDARREGSYGLDAEVPAGVMGQGAGVFLDVSTQTTGLFAVRLWFKSITTFDRFNGLILLTGPNMGFTNNYLLAGGNSAGRWVLSEGYNGSVNDYPSQVDVPAIGTWTCVELDYDLSARRAVLYVDDVVRLESDVEDIAPAVIRVDVGVANASANGYHANVDDVAIATEHIGCR